MLDVTLTQAALGADVTFETLDGSEHVRIEPGTESGQLIRLRGKGVPNLSRRGRGDLYVTVHVTVPKDLKRDERKLLEQLAERPRRAVVQEGSGDGGATPTRGLIPIPTPCRPRRPALQPYSGSRRAGPGS